MKKNSAIGVLLMSNLMLLAFWVYDVDFFSEYESDKAGSAAEWVSGIATLLAVVVALALARGDRTERERVRDGQRRERAAVVNLSWQSLPDAIGLVATNHSPVEISDVEVGVDAKGGVGPFLTQFPTVAPGDQAVVRPLRDDALATEMIGRDWMVRFTAENHRWRKDLNGHLSLVR